MKDYYTPIFLWFLGIVTMVFLCYALHAGVLAFFYNDRSGVHDILLVMAMAYVVAMMGALILCGISCVHEFFWKIRQKIRR